MVAANWWEGAPALELWYVKTVDTGAGESSNTTTGFHFTDWRDVTARIESAYGITEPSVGSPDDDANRPHVKVNMRLDGTAWGDAYRPGTYAERLKEPANHPWIRLNIVGERGSAATKPEIYASNATTRVYRFGRPVNVECPINLAELTVYVDGVAVREYPANQNFNQSYDYTLTMVTDEDLTARYPAGGFGCAFDIAFNATSDFSGSEAVTIAGPEAIPMLHTHGTTDGTKANSWVVAEFNPDMDLPWDVDTRPTTIRTADICLIPQNYQIFDAGAGDYKHRYLTITTATGRSDNPAMKTSTLRDFRAHGVMLFTAMPSQAAWECEGTWNSRNDNTSGEGVGYYGGLLDIDGCMLFGGSDELSHQIYIGHWGQVNFNNNYSTDMSPYDNQVGGHNPKVKCDGDVVISGNFIANCWLEKNGYGPSGITTLTRTNSIGSRGPLDVFGSSGLKLIEGNTIVHTSTGGDSFLDLRNRDSQPLASAKGSPPYNNYFDTSAANPGAYEREATIYLMDDGGSAIDMQANALSAAHSFSDSSLTFTDGQTVFNWASDRMINDVDDVQVLLWPANGYETTLAPGDYTVSITTATASSSTGTVTIKTVGGHADLTGGLRSHAGRGAPGTGRSDMLFIQAGLADHGAAFDYNKAATWAFKTPLLVWTGGSSGGDAGATNSFSTTVGNGNRQTYLAGNGTNATFRFTALEYLRSHADQIDSLDENDFLVWDMTNGVEITYAASPGAGEYSFIDNADNTFDFTFGATPASGTQIGISVEGPYVGQGATSNQTTDAFDKLINAPENRLFFCTALLRNNNFVSDARIVSTGIIGLRESGSQPRFAAIASGDDWPRPATPYFRPHHFAAAFNNKFDNVAVGKFSHHDTTGPASYGPAGSFGTNRKIQRLANAGGNSFAGDAGSPIPAVTVPPWADVSTPAMRGWKEFD